MTLIPKKRSVIQTNKQTNAKYVCGGAGCVGSHSKTYQFLSASFRNLTNAINSTYYQAFVRNVWESVVSEA